MIAIVMAAFIVTFTNGSVKEKGQPKTDLEFASTQSVETIQKESTYFS
jgi:FlaG/FlaF family flagellin (archaellin)